MLQDGTFYLTSPSALPNSGLSRHSLGEPQKRQDRKETAYNGKEDFNLRREMFSTKKSPKSSE